MHRPLRGVVAALCALLALTACDGAPRVSAPNESNVKVDTPAYRAVKQQAGIEDCPAPQTTDGGLPDVSLPCLGGGRRVDLSTLKGPLVLNFWQGACEPCREEMPALGAFYKKYGDRVPILGVDSNDTMPGYALDRAKAYHVTYPIVADPGGELQGSDLTIRGFPTFFFLTADGELEGPVAGGLRSVDEVVALVEKQLGIAL